jgi:hypothetical protein
MKKIIAFSGWKGSGKDTLAGYVVQNCFAERVAFADPLKDAASQEFNIPRYKMDDPKHKDSPILDMPVDPQDAYSEMICHFMNKEFRMLNGREHWTPRALCILKGSTNRSVQSNYWVQKAIDKIRASVASYCLITDLRYKSEMDQLKDAFGADLSCVRINRFDQTESQDPSERDLDDAKFDYVINNNGDLESAFQQMELILDQIGEN